MEVFPEATTRSHKLMMPQKIKRIVFSCCNSANPDCYNIANAFYKRMNVNTIVGFDGGVRYNYKTNVLEAGSDKNQTTWRKYAPIYLNGFLIKYKRVRMGRRELKNGIWSKLEYNVPSYIGSKPFRFFD